jgi:hypothetical protein
MMTLFDSDRDATREAVAKPIPEEPPVMRTVLFRRFLSWEGEVLTILESGMMLMFRRLKTRSTETMGAFKKQEGKKRSLNTIFEAERVYLQKYLITTEIIFHGFELSSAAGLEKASVSKIRERSDQLVHANQTGITWHPRGVDAIGMTLRLMSGLERVTVASFPLLDIDRHLRDLRSTRQQLIYSTETSTALLSLHPSSSSGLQRSVKASSDPSSNLLTSATPQDLHLQFLPRRTSFRNLRNSVGTSGASSLSNTLEVLLHESEEDSDGSAMSALIARQKP